MVDDGYQEEKVSEGEAKMKCWMLNKKRVAEFRKGLRQREVAKAYGELHVRLDTKDGEKELYPMVRDRPGWEACAAGKGD